MTEREEQAVIVLNTLYNNPLLSDIHRQALEMGIMAIKAASRSENPNKWISVESALPEEGEEVLVCYRYWRYGEYNNWYYTYGIGYQYNDNWSVIDGGLRTTVFAWMPLPEPYKASPTGAESEDDE